MRSKTLLIKLFAVLGIASFAFLAGCGGSTGSVSVGDVTVGREIFTEAGI
ncbi:MAG TPA: hypothetical protein VN948_20865 [Terriglobales bacterium]|nr:hypothetical protein [Terriglobales bacterium]